MIHNVYFQYNKSLMNGDNRLTYDSLTWDTQQGQTYRLNVRLLYKRGIKAAHRYIVMESQGSLNFVTEFPSN